jgi:hypothetical protein
LNTTTLPTGTLNVVASYGGDSNYAASQSAATTLIVIAQTIAITPSTASLSVTAGSSGSLTFTVTSLAGFNGLIGVSCSGLPANSACAFSQNGFPLTTAVPQQVTVQILTGQVPVVPQPPVGELSIPGMGHRLPVSLALLLLAPLGLVRRRLWKKYRGLMLLILLLCGSVGAMTIAGCGNTLFGVTPPGQTAVTLTVYGTNSATSATVTQTAQIALTVQK